MKRLEFSRYALGFCSAVAAFTACSTPQSSTIPPTISGAIATRRRPAGAEYKVVYAFPSVGSSCPNGALPEDTLTAVYGILYGTTVLGGAYGAGTLFALTTSGTEQVRLSFNNQAPSPNNPGAGVIAVNGTLFGTTPKGGAHNLGAVYGIGIASRNAGIIHSFGGPKDGKTPVAPVIAVNGLLYGTTASGGSHDDGTVFSISLGTGTERVLYSFGSRRLDGKAPYSPLLFLKGDLYGTTTAGGASGAGTIFAIDPSTGKERVIYGFYGHNFDGQSPEAALISVNGKLYGTTLEGGAYGYSSGGTVFRIDPSGDNESIVHSFGNGNDGQRPYSPVVSVNGKLYGTTSAGGVNGGNGTLYSIDLSSGMERVLHSFGSGQSDGAYPVGGLLKLNGKLYGTTAVGGILGDCIMSAETGSGTVFMFNP